MFDSLEAMVVSAAESVRPPERLDVAEAAEKYRRLGVSSARPGPWRNDLVPYMIEPMGVLTSMSFTGEVIVAPAQSSKTEIGLNWTAYTAICDPAHIRLVEKTQESARMFSLTRVDPMLRDSPDIGGRLRSGASNDNRFDKRFQSGAFVSIAWPTINSLAGSPIPRMFLTDYDRMEQDVGGEGAPFDLARARTTTFGHYGMTVAESSPSYPILDPRWTPATPHQAPPTGGILGLYNRGDRRRWYWLCVECGNSFEPDFTLMRWPETTDILEAAEASWLECPHCSAQYSHDPGARPGKHEMNRNGFWLKDGERRLADGRVVGTPAKSEIASFWIKGPAAAFKTWTTLVSNFLLAQHEYDQTGMEEALKTTINVDQALAYLPKELESERLPEILRDRAFDFGQREVPEEVRFLVASVDVQKGRFVVQVQGIGQGGDIWIIDRFNIRYSLRRDRDREDQFMQVRPFTYPEDWRLLLREVILKRYPLIDGSGREMAIKATIADSGGMNEATSNAYAFWRWLRHGPTERDDDFSEWEDEWSPGLHNRFILYKGDAKTDTRTRITHPDSSRKDRHAGARGEIPVLLVNSNMVKDYVNAILDRENHNTGRVNFPTWLDLNFYKELCVETKDLKGQWVNPRNFRNESWDLMVMAQALLIERRFVGVESIDWSDPPVWALEWDDNPLVTDAGTPGALVAEKRGQGYSVQELGGILG